MVSPVDLVSAPTSSNPYIKALLGTYAFRPGYQIVYALQGNPGDTALLGGALWAEQGAAQAFQNAAAAWMAVANITITAATTAYDGTGSRAGFTWVEKLTSLGEDVLGQHALPGPGNLGGDFNNRHEIFTAANNAIGGYSFLTFLHEMGHGLGLTHPHEPGKSFPGVSDDDDTGDNGLNQSIYTVMSYNDDIADAATNTYASGWSATPMAFDIAAIQAMYGANMTTATGDNVYILPSLGGTGNYWACIWDAGGIDTIDGSAAAGRVVIDLRAATLLDEEGGGGRISQVNNAAGGFTIANGVVIENAAGGAGNDSIYGNDAANRLLGGAGNDTIHGYGGDDYIDAGTGAATLFGEEGNDRLYANLSTTDSTLDGGNGDDWLIGGSGNDTFWGGAGADLIWGGAGNDWYHVDTQNDVIFENANDGYDRVQSSVGYYLYDGVEALYLDNGAAFGVGNALDNYIAAGTGDTLLIGGGGDDELDASIGKDQLFGGDGADTLYGRAGIDYLVGGAGNDTLYGGDDADALYGEDGDDMLDAGGGFVTDILVGGAGNDILDGDGGDADYDLMDGGSGNDTYYVDTGDDLTFEAVGGGTDTVYATVAGTNNGVYLYANVENLVLLGTTTFGVGNELANTLTGNAAANWLLGGAGSDTLNGKGGNDVLFGEAGADIFVFEHGTKGDVIGDFAVGTDRIDLRAFGLSWQTIQNSMHENGGTTAIDLGNGDFIVLNGVAANTLSQGDFILGGGSSAKAAPSDDVAVLDAAFVHAQLWHGAAALDAIFL